jgi:hypothetical protein
MSNGLAALSKESPLVVIATDAQQAPEAHVAGRCYE